EVIIESGKDVQFGIIVRNPKEYGPTDCEEARRIVDNAFYKVREQPEAKIEFVIHNGEADEKVTSDKRENSVAAFCGTRGFGENCSIKRGGDNKGIASMDVNVKGELFGVIYFAKNKPSPCPNPDNWDVY